MARDLRVHPRIIQRARGYRRDDRARVRTAIRGRTEITALRGRYYPDNEPDRHNEPSDSHGYLRNMALPTKVGLPSTPGGAAYAAYRDAGSSWAEAGTGVSWNGDVMGTECGRARERAGGA